MSAKLNKPDYTSCIANLANSVLVSFGAQPNGATLPVADYLLAKGHKNVVVFLLDGMGISVMESNLDQDGFFCSHLVTGYDSVFPPTTVAATTSMLSGLMPCEHSLPGWDCYFEEIDKSVSIFPNTETGTGIPAADYDVAAKFCPYENVIDKINRAGGQAYFATPFCPPFPGTLEEIFDCITELCAQSGRKYIYAYYNEPDSTMHRAGAHSPEAVEMVRSLEQHIKKLIDTLEDTLFIVTADHSHIDVHGADIYDYPAITECLVRAPAIEPRTAAFFVKEDKKQQFEEEFNKAFGENFLLLTRQQVLDEQLFGTGVEHERFRSMLGDYLALAVSNLCIFRNQRDVKRYKGHHAGFTEAERRIPLIVIEKQTGEDRER